MYDCVFWEEFVYYGVVDWMLKRFPRQYNLEYVILGAVVEKVESLWFADLMSWG